MKLLVLFVSVALLFSHVLAAPFQLQIPATSVRTDTNLPALEPCRMFDRGPATCVEQYLRKEDDTNLCSYRLCAASYVPAESCPATQALQATDKCVVKQVTKDVYKCDGVSYKTETSPKGCHIGEDNCKEIHACSCTKTENYTSKTLTWETSYIPNCPSEKQVSFDCAKCGQVLECYVNSGSAEVDAHACSIILDRAQFCPKKGRTVCNQQCDGKEQVKCYSRQRWATCPAVLGSKNGAAKCKGGANGKPAALSNFASYTISLGSQKQARCFKPKCDEGLTCPCYDTKSM